MAIQISQPESIQSIDVLDLVYRIDRALTELVGSVSATRNESTPEDIARWKGLHDDLNRKFGIYQGQAELDLPKYHPVARLLPEPPVLEEMQNRDVMNQVNLLIAIRTELCMGEAAERVSGFSEAQATRVGTVLERWGEVLDDIESNPEVDAPNTPDQKPF